LTRAAPSRTMPAGNVDMSSRSAEAPPSLVDRCRRGDRDAWRDLVAEYSRYVYAIIMRGYRLPESDAEDVFQEVFARVFERLETLRDDDALRGWIAQVTRNLCADHLRRARPTEELTEATVGGVDDRVADIDDALAVRQALRRLPAGCAEILDRFFCRDEPYRTISQALGIPAGTIASRISRCLGRLRREMDGRDGGPDASGGE
jgi:RNA polymerase sigma factor (sigma-70 family)